MKKAIMILVTVLFVAVALNGFAHHRHHKHEVRKEMRAEKHNRDNKDCYCVKERSNRPQMEREGVQPKGHQEFRKDNGRHGRKDVNEVKGTVNGKTASVSVGELLTPCETGHISRIHPEFKGRMNGKTALVYVGSPLTQFEVNQL